MIVHLNKIIQSTNIFYKSESSLQIKESSSNPEKYLEIGKTIFGYYVLSIHKWWRKVKKESRSLLCYKWLASLALMVLAARLA